MKIDIAIEKKVRPMWFRKQKLEIEMEKLLFPVVRGIVKIPRCFSIGGSTL